MKTIIVINDGSAEAEHAAEMALNIAQKVNASLLLANVFQVGARVPAKEYVLTSGSIENVAAARERFGLLKKLRTLVDPALDIKPEINEIDASEFTVNDLAKLVIKDNIWMIVKGLKESTIANDPGPTVNIQSVLNKVMCPVLLVPEKWAIKDLERIVYMADLRYCQLPVVRYLANMAKPFDANVQVAHVSAKGLPDMEQNYALSFFRDAICNNVKYGKLLFNNIREKSLQKVAEVMISVLHTDLLVLINHQYHFEELVGQYITNSLPEHVKVPLLVFPG